MSKSKYEVSKSQHDGSPMLVLRATDPQMGKTAATLAVQAAKENDGDLFARIPSAIENYRIMGWLSRTGEIVNKDGSRVIGKPEPGDLLASEVSVKKSCEPG